MDTRTHCVGARLREARKKANLTQRKLGMLVGMDEFSAGPRINQYEKGKHIPDFFTVSRLAKALNYPVEYFYSIEDDYAELNLLFFGLTPVTKKKFLNQLRNS